MTLAAGALIYGTVACVVSLLAYLPALAVAEALSPTQPGRRVRVWLAALALPPLAGLAAAGWGLRSVATDPYGSPHLTCVRPHLCARWLLELPDIGWLLTMAAVGVVGLGAAAVVRFGLGAIRSVWFARRCGEHEAESGVCLVAAHAPVIATVGLFKGKILLTSGAAELLPAEELKAALAHERAHVARRDNLTDLLAAALATLLGFVPTSHLYLRYLREDIERACDDAAAEETDRLAVAAAVSRLAAHAQAAARARLLPPQGLRGKQAAADAARRALRLATPSGTDREATEGSVAAAVLAVGGGLAIALGLWGTAGQIRDTVRCLAESLLGALR